MKEYRVTDADGEKLIIEKDNGIRVEILEKPSAEYIANMPPPTEEPEPRDYLAEIDSFHGRIDDLKARVKAIEAKVPSA